jgi:hypothetical protein
MVDAGDSKSPAERLVGSSPTLGTRHTMLRGNILCLLIFFSLMFLYLYYMLVLFFQFLAMFLTEAG